MTPKLLRTAKDALRTSFLRGYPDMLKELEAFFDKHIAELERGERAAIILRPIASTWEVGPEGQARVYTDAPRALRAVHALLAGAKTLHAPQYVRPGASYPGNALRDGIARQVPAWAARIGCPAIAEAVKHMRVTKAGVATYEPPLVGLPRFVTV